jgi:hypothetical protein
MIRPHRTNSHLDRTGARRLSLRDRWSGEDMPDRLEVGSVFRSVIRFRNRRSKSIKILSYNSRGFCCAKNACRKGDSDGGPKAIRQA